MKKKILNVKKHKRRLKDWCMINSYAGWLCHCNSWRLYEKYIDPMINWVVEYYRKFINKKKADKFKRKILKLKGCFTC